MPTYLGSLPLTSWLPRYWPDGQWSRRGDSSILYLSLYYAGSSPLLFFCHLPHYFSPPISRRYCYHDDELLLFSPDISLSYFDFLSESFTISIYAYFDWYFLSKATCHFLSLIFFFIWWYFFLFPFILSIYTSIGHWFSAGFHFSSKPQRTPLRSSLWMLTAGCQCLYHWPSPDYFSLSFRILL